MTNGSKEQIVHDAVHGTKDRFHRMLLLGVCLLAVLSLVVAAWAAWEAYKPVKEQAQRATSLAQQVKAACADPTTVTSPDLKSLCNQASAVVSKAPTVVQGAPGPEGSPGPSGPPGPAGPAPSTSQVASAVALYCQNNGCKGKDGKNATQEDVTAAVSMYCDSRGDCAGPRGQNGSPPTDAQIQSAVSTYCSNHDSCQGPAGPKGDTVTGPAGPSGAPGAPGKGISSVECSGLGVDSFTVHYTDGTTQQVACTPTGGSSDGQ
jgi:hypothetical protein